MKLKKFWPVGGARAGGAPPKSATVDLTTMFGLYKLLLYCLLDVLVDELQVLPNI